MESNPADSARSRTPNALHAGIGAVLVVATLAVYFQVRDHDFVNYDDYVYLANIDTGLSVEGVRKALTSHIVSNWIPVTWIMLLAEFDVFGRNPAGYHLVGVAIHAASAVLLFFFLWRFTGATWRSAFVAAVFALHPLHVESVAWFSERKDVLSGLFFMLTLHAYSRAEDRDGFRGWMLVALLCLAVGLMAKPMLVTLPFVLVLLDYWPLGRIRRSGLREEASAVGRSLSRKWAFLVLAAMVSAGALLTQDLAGSIPGTEVLTLPRRIGNALDSYWLYVRDSLWPAGLAVYYPHSIEAAPGRSVAIALGLVAVTAAAVATRARSPYFLVGWLWYLGMLVPVIGLVQVGSQARADRYTYLPQIGLALVLAWGANGWLGGLRWGRVALACGGTAAVVVLAVVSWLQVSTWKDTIALQSHAVAVTENNFRSRNGLAAALRRAGRLEESVVHYAEASRLAPQSARTHIGRAEVLAELDRLDEAIDAYEAGLDIQPRHIRAQINLGHTLMRAERYTEARGHFETALEIDGGDGLVASGAKRFAVSLHHGMARVLALEGADGAASDLDGSIEHYQKLLALRPADATAHAELGKVLYRAGRRAEAREHLLEAGRLRSR